MFVQLSDFMVRMFLPFLYWIESKTSVPSMDVTVCFSRESDKEVLLFMCMRIKQLIHRKEQRIQKIFNLLNANDKAKRVMDTASRVIQTNGRSTDEMRLPEDRRITVRIHEKGIKFFIFTYTIAGKPCFHSAEYMVVFRESRASAEKIRKKNYFGGYYGQGFYG